MINIQPELSEGEITSNIHSIRGVDIMLDSDLATLYQTQTKRLNEQVKRNLDRFPPDFMFQLTENEWENLRSQNATSKWGGRRIPPYVFTEHGILMLSSVLKSERASEVNIQIMRVYNRMRKMLSSHKELLSKMIELEKKCDGNDEKIEQILDYIQRITSNGGISRKKIGYLEKE